MSRKLIGVLAMTAVLVLPMGSALAHVGLEPSEVAPGSGTTISFRIGHGCDHEPTTSVSVRIPAGVISVSPFPKPGWELTVETGNLPAPVDTGGQTVTEGVTVVTWSGGSLEDAHTDVFQIRASVYGEPGTTVYFPVIQACDDADHAWIEVPVAGQDPHSLASPAPALTLAAGDTGEKTEGGNETLTLVALGLGALGAILGLVALIRRRT